MLRDVYWRQYPIDLLSDEKMACVEAMLPDDQKHIPYMIYIAALKLCDDNGVFDLDDGVVLARLTRVNNPRLVLDIVNMMRQRKILFRLFDDSTLCGLTDWTYSDKKPRTIEERRRLVNERIQKEQSRAGVDKDFTLPGDQAAPAAAASTAAPEAETAPAAAATFPIPDYIKKCKLCDAYDAANKLCTDNTLGNCKRHLSHLYAAPEAETMAAPQDFLCAKNDKNAENVVKSEMDDKNAKNVVTLQDNTVQDNNTGQTDSTNIHTDTHTIQQVPSSGRLNSPTLETCENTNAVGEKIQTEYTDDANINTDEVACGDEAISNLADQALREARQDGEEKDTGELVAYLNDYFVKKSYGVFKKSQGAAAINKLAEKVLELSDDVNPPVDVAAVMCSEFKKMCDGGREEYWKGMPLLPANMIKGRVMAEIIQNTGKILATTKNSNKFIAAAQKAQEECEEDRALVSDAVREEYLKYNIDPEDPNAQRLLLMAKSREAQAEREAEDENFEIF